MSESRPPVGGIAGLYEVVVSELAHSQVMASTTTYARPDEVVATGGSLSVALYGNPPVNIPPTAIAGSMSVRQLADAINADCELSGDRGSRAGRPGSVPSGADRTQHRQRKRIHRHQHALGRQGCRLH